MWQHNSVYCGKKQRQTERMEQNRVDGQMDRQTDRRTDRRMDRRTDRRTDRQTELSTIAVGAFNIVTLIVNNSLHLATEVRATLADCIGNYKAAGPDGFKPIVLKNLLVSCINRLRVIYTSSLYAGYVPACWRRSKVVFILKPRRDDRMTTLRQSHSVLSPQHPTSLRPWKK